MKSSLFRVLIGFLSKLPGNTVLDIDMSHRIIKDKFKIDSSPSTIKGYLTLLANAGYSVKKRKVKRRKATYFIIDGRGRWPFKVELSDVKAQSVARGTASTEVVNSEAELGNKLATYAFEILDEPLEVKQAPTVSKEETAWHDIDFSQIWTEGLREVLLATRVSDSSLARILKQVLADTILESEMAKEKCAEIGAKYSELSMQFEKMKECKKTLEENNKSLEGKLFIADSDINSCKTRLSSSEKKVSELEVRKQSLSDQLLKEQQYSKDLEQTNVFLKRTISGLETKVKGLEQERDNLANRLKGLMLDRDNKFTTIGEVLKSKKSGG